MAFEIKQVAVLGANSLGGHIAAMFANAGIHTLLFANNQSRSERRFRRLKLARVSPFYAASQTRFITPCNYQEDLEILADADWVIIAGNYPPEDLATLLEKAKPFLKSTVLISAAAPGRSLEEYREILGEDFQENFLLTYFFFPPREMPLLEFICPADKTEYFLESLSPFCEDRLGHQPVFVKDTPAGVANRIGIFSLASVLHIAREMGLSVEAIDLLTGPLIGRSKNATCRLLDKFGLDNFAFLNQHIYNTCSDDEQRDRFLLPEYLEKLIAEKHTGQQNGKGFYKKEQQEIMALNIPDGSYRSLTRETFESVRLAKSEQTLPGKLRALVACQDVAGKFIWETLSACLIYAANRIPEIADDVATIDTAMRDGFGWQLGPFQIWDALGFEETAVRMKNDGKKLPLWVEAMLLTGGKSFYAREEGHQQMYDILSGKMTLLPMAPGRIDLAQEKAQRTALRENWSASLLDIGDEVLCVEFHSIHQPAKNLIDPGVFEIMESALSTVAENGYRGLIIANQGENFSGGMNLKILYKLIEQENWDALSSLSRRAQDINLKLMQAPFPVISVPFNTTRGVGLSLAMATTRMIASANLKCGLTESQLGLIPFGGGTSFFLANWIARKSSQTSGPFPPVREAFETIFHGKTAASGLEALQMGFLRPSDKVLANHQQLLYSAKQSVLEMTENYTPTEIPSEFYLPGEGGRIALEIQLDSLQKRGAISEYDHLVGKHLAHVLTGGPDASPTHPIHMETLLTLERDTFISLCQAPKTRERIAHFLNSGKYLKN